MGKKSKKPGKGKEKTEKKTLKSQEKKARREEKAVAEEDDIDKILAQIKKEDAKKVEVQVDENVAAPSPRCNCTVTLNPLKDTELILYGGEYYNGDKTYVYGDLYRYNIEKKEWKHVSSPNSPPPRSAHQAVAWKNFLFIFGGEFTSPNQERFHHYKDLWRLDLNTNVWEQLNLKGGPSPRSGHRMVLYKHKLLVFGGFYDTLREVRYFDDLHVLDLDEMKWTEVKQKPGAIAPSPRSAFQMALNGDEVFLYGGYFKDYKASKDGGGDDKGNVLADIWCLDPRTFIWEKVKKQGSPPGPRAGFSLCVHKKRAVMFGGVVDAEDKEKDDLKSTFLNEMFIFQMDNKRWFPLELRKPKAPKGRTKSKPVAKVQAQKEVEEDDAESGDDFDAEKVVEEMDEEVEEVVSSKAKKKKKKRGGLKSSAAGGSEAAAENSEEGQSLIEEMDRQFTGEAQVADDEDAHVADAGEGVGKIDLDDIVGEMDEEVERRVGPGGPKAGETDPPETEKDAPEDAGGGEELSADAILGELDEELEERFEAEEAKGGAEEAPSRSKEQAEQSEDAPSVPCGRINASLVVSGNMLLLYGGIMEAGDKEITLDDLWTLDLAKLDGWTQLIEATETDWVEVEDEEESDDDEEEEEEGSSDNEESEEEGEEPAPLTAGEEAAAALRAIEAGKMSRKQRKIELDRLRSELGLQDADRTPLAGESLREFFARTGKHWQIQAYEITSHTGKELRRDGFELAEARYEELRPVLTELERLEKEQQAEEEELAKAALKAKEKKKVPSRR
ncbi:hypothetical protein KFL_001150260 [Klebsormidium nitens]|uniref:DUF4110 domain-containing protein n=1 Tax=Klebsormidium nitens TaxID=105231 RepID=A0A1Y1I1B5_KLENI|nr:hypothetical protein KFL_001150260 [Klebsormidium nitens]|eukprot:GAQ82566.1 hypothetical protein KFL_001150260 [Klebsormidium nitens]